jgi:hypothetical protein
MTYLEIILLIQERKETVLTEEVSSVITNSHHYIRQSGEWVEDMEPGAPEKHFGRSGEYYVWVKAIEDSPSI